MALSKKARLVVRGFLQSHAGRAFAPVMDLTSILTTIALAVQKGWTIRKLDVCKIFLRGEIDIDV